MKRRSLLMVVLALVLALSLINLPDHKIQAQDEKALIIAFDQEFDSLNPMYSTMYFTGVARTLYLAPAWDFDDELNPRPVLVTEMPTEDNGGITDGGQTLTLHLRDDIKWSDGEPITSADFVFTYEMIMNESNTPLSRYPYDEYVASVEGPDAQTVVVHFTAPFAPWVASIFTYVLPEHVLRLVFEEDLTLDGAEWNRAPRIGSGPYVFDEWETGSYVRFTRNDNYFGPSPIIDVIAITFIPDSAAYVIALENEDADVGTFIAYSDVPALQESGHVNISMVPSGYNEALFFNVNPATGHPALQDVNVRRAITMGFNREQITNDLLLGLTYPAVSYWENTPYANPDLEAIPYDPDQAKTLLEEAGWVDSNGDGIREKDGVDLQLRWVTNTRQIRLDTAVVAQQQLREIGVELVLENYPSDQFFNGYGEDGPVAHGNFDIAEWSASPYFPDPDTGRFRCDQIPTDESPDGANWTGLCDETLDTLFDQQATEMNYDTRVELFHQIDAALNDTVVWVGVWHDPDIWVVNNKVQGAQLNGIYPFWNIYEWDVVE